MRHNDLMNLARLAARQSPNRVRQVGAAISICGLDEIVSACNTFPYGVSDLDWRHEGDGRFVWMEHAERNAIFLAARAGKKLEGATIASTFFPCIDCARAIVQSGITCLATSAPDYDDPVWGTSFARSKIILEEGGVDIMIVSTQDSSI